MPTPILPGRERARITDNSNAPSSPWTAASALILGLNNTSGAGSTIFTGSNAIDAAGGTGLTIEAGPGFNWTGGVGNGEADVDTGTAGLNKQAWSGGAVGAAPPSTTADMSASTVDGFNTTTQFKSSGDPMNTCPPSQAEIDAGMPFCYDAFETTGSGPSATDAEVGFAGQNLPSSQAPTAQLNASTASIGQSVTVNDVTGACPSTIGGLGAGSANLFNATYNCWYAHAGDSTPVSVTVDGLPATVTPNPTTTQVSGVSVTSGSAVATVSPSETGGFPTNLIGDLVTDTAGDIPAGTTVASQGNGTTGNYADVEVTLSNSATAPDASDTLTFTNNADVSEADYSVDNVTTTTSANGADATITLVNENATNTVQTCTGSGTPVAGCTAVSAGTAATPYNLVGDSVSGTGVPPGTEVTAQSGTGPGATLTLSKSTLAAQNGDNETLTFYQTILNPPQLNANFTIPAGTPAGNQTVQVCEATTPTNGNDWEFGVQWLSAQGSLTNIAGDSPVQTQICATSTVDVTQASSSTTTTPTSSSIVLGNTNTDSATVTGSVNGIDPTGSVNFYECGPTAGPMPCTSGSWTQFDTEPLSGTSNPDTVTSAAFTPDSTGTWCFAGVYSGDSNYSGSSDGTDDECFTVNQAGSSTASAPTNASVVSGGSNTDVATVTGVPNAPAPTGSVDFYWCGDNVSPCTPTTPGVTADPANPVALVGGSATSSSFTPDASGTWCYDAVYSGDSNYTGSSDSSPSDECFSVAVATSSTVTAPTSSTIMLGLSNSDVATVSGNATYGTPTGSVDFYWCGENVSPCTPTTPGVTADPANPVALLGGSATSSSFTPDSAGTWCYDAVYSGDSNYNGSSDSNPSDECFTVSQVDSTTVSAPSSSTASLDGPNSDTVLITGDDGAANAPFPTGSVTFYTCAVNVDPCTSSSWQQLGNPVTLGAGSVNTNSATSSDFDNTAAGTWCFAAVYSGDSNYSGSSDATSDECYTVSEDTSSTLSAPESASILTGQSNTDKATVTGNATVGAPSGTVTFYECGPTANVTPCASGTQIGNPVSLTADGDSATATSANFTPPNSLSSIGYWCFRAVYGGDSNYTGSTDGTVDECFFVNAPLQITTSSPLPSGHKTVNYSQQLAAAGGTAPYKWSLKSGTLPPSLTLSASGLISGYASAKGTYTFTVKIKDSSTPKQRATKVFTLTIGKAPVT